jgi:death-on-curing protein
LKPSKTNSISYLESEDILLIHSAVVDETGGSHGVRDLGRVEAVADHPRQKVFGKELMESLFEKAASYTFDIINHHPFVDGNKRTGMSAAAVFLELNGFILKSHEGSVEEMAVKIITSKLDISAIAGWFEENSRKG